MLELRDVSFSYGSNDAVKGVSLTVERGEIFCLLGPNGAGKSTLIKLMSGLLKPSSGSISIDGTDLASLTLTTRATKIAVLAQGARAPAGFTSLEMVLMGRTPYVSALGFESKEDIAKALAAMEKTDCAIFCDRRIDELSGGERQRVFLARALAQEPEILILDEPTTYMDIRHISKMKELIKSLNACGITFVCALHDISLASSICDRICLMKDGGVAALGHPSKVVSSGAIESVFGVNLSVGIDERTGRPFVLA